MGRSGRLQLFHLRIRHNTCKDKGKLNVPELGRSASLGALGGGKRVEGRVVGVPVPESPPPSSSSSTSSW